MRKYDHKVGTRKHKSHRGYRLISPKKQFILKWEKMDILIYKYSILTHVGATLH